MKTVGFSTTLIWLTIISLVMSFFISTKTSHCPTEEQQLVWAGICAGETLTSTSVWSVTHPPQMAETKFLFLILIVFTQLPTVTRIFTRKMPQPGITRYTSVLIRSGPIPPRTFIPCLFATHGW